VITINGNNPAEIEVGSVFGDLGASVTDNVDKNLGIKALVDGVDIGELSNVQIDTASTSLHMIEYYALDSAGNRGSATRTVNVVTPPIPPPAPE
jgi:hypothetical protein